MTLSVVATKDDSLDTFPKWMDQDATKKVMNKRNNQTSKETNRDNWKMNSTNTYCFSEYSRAFKAASLKI